MASNNGPTLKLVIDTKADRVLFAEANKDAVDFLFSLLALPLGTVTKLLTKESMVGSIASLYKSIESLDQTYIAPNQNKSSLLSPNTTTASYSLFPTEAITISKTSETPVKKYYRCSGSKDGCKQYFSDVSYSMCSCCNGPKAIEMQYEASSTSASGTGFVASVVTYTVLDDLSVTPMSTISSIRMLSKFQVKDIAYLQEQVVNLELEHGLELLKASLQSKTVLTDVFLNNKCKKQGKPQNYQKDFQNGMGKAKAKADTTKKKPIGSFHRKEKLLKS